MPKRTRTDRGWPAISPQSGHGRPGPLAGVEDHLEHPEDRRAERLAEVGDLGIVAVGGDQVLDQVVRADRDEVGLAEDRVDADGGGGDLDHHAGLDVLAERHALAAEVAPGLLDQPVDVPQLLQRRDHREEHRDLAVPPGAEDRADLPLEEPRMLEREPDRPPAHERVGLVPPAQVGDGLVAAEVEGADRDGPVGRVLDDLAVVLVLLLLVGHVLVGEEEVFGAEQADARWRRPSAAAWASARLLMLASSSIRAPSALTAGWSRLRTSRSLRSKNSRCILR